MAEHHSLTSRVAFEIAWLLRQERYGVDPYACAIAALYHDEPEVLVGDIPHPARKLLPGDTFKELEDSVTDNLWSVGYPQELAKKLRSFVRQEDLNEEEKQIVRYADDLTAYAFVVDEVEMGNPQMVETKEIIESRLEKMEFPWLSFLRNTQGFP